jgi:hypothetical protein
MKAYLRAASCAALAVCAGGALLSSAMAQNDAAANAPPPASDVLPHDALEAASAYATFIHRASAIPAHFADSAAIVQALNTSEGYEPGQLQQGLVAYAALVAIDDPRFAEGVRAAAPDPDSRERLVQALMANPALAQQLPGSADAAQLIGLVLRSQAQGLAARGDAIRQASYDIQLQAPWSTRMTPDPEQRLQSAKLISATRVAAAADDIAQMMAETRADQAPVTTGEGRSAGLSQAVARSLALAAIAIAGTPDEAQAASQAMLSEAGAGQCLHMAKLNLYQCLAVAGPHYEDMFCMGRHAMMETAQCVSDAAGPAPAPMPASYAQTAYAPTPASYASAPDYAQPIDYSRAPTPPAEQSPAPPPASPEATGAVGPAGDAAATSWRWAAR